MSDQSNIARAGETTREARRVPHPIDTYPEILTAQEAADVLRISHSQLLRMVREERIPANKVGGRWRVLKSTVMSLVTPPAAENVAAR